MRCFRSFPVVLVLGLVLTCPAGAAMPRGMGIARPAMRFARPAATTVRFSVRPVTMGNSSFRLTTVPTPFGGQVSTLSNGTSTFRLSAVPVPGGGQVVTAFNGPNSTIRLSSIPGMNGSQVTTLRTFGNGQQSPFFTNSSFNLSSNGFRSNSRFFLNVSNQPLSGMNNVHRFLPTHLHGLQGFNNFNSPFNPFTANPSLASLAAAAAASSGGYGGGGGGSPGSSQPVSMPAAAPSAQPMAAMPSEAGPSIFDVLGVPNRDGRMVWPLGLRILPPDAETRQLRAEIEAELLAAGAQAITGQTRSPLMGSIRGHIQRLRALLDQNGHKLTQNAATSARQFLHALDSTIQASAVLSTTHAPNAAEGK